MKCLYYLAPSLDCTETLSDDLHKVGVHDWFIHIHSKDEAGLQKKHLHSSNYLEKLDFIRTGFIGANIGFIVGVLASGFILFVKPFGPVFPTFAYIAIVIFTTLFGAWEGGLYGVATENRKLSRFHDDIEAGHYLFLIYARTGKAEIVIDMLKEKHPESQHVATDRHFISPFSVVRRKRDVATRATD